MIGSAAGRFVRSCVVPEMQSELPALLQNTTFSKLDFGNRRPGISGRHVCRTKGALKRLQFCKPKRLGEGPKQEIPQKVVRRGCKGHFGPRGQWSPKSLVHHPKSLLHRRNPSFRTSARGNFVSLGPKVSYVRPSSRVGLRFKFKKNLKMP